MNPLIKKLKNFWIRFIQFWSYFFVVLAAFKPHWEKFVKFLANWNEIITIPIGFAMFYFTPILLRLIDSSSAGFDLGILHSIIFAIAAMLIINGFVFLLLKLTFPSVFKFIDEVFEVHFYQNSSIANNLNTYQKCVLSLLLFSVYLLGTILLVKF